VVELDRQIVLNWGENQERVTETESTNDKGFAFQGYNVYQLPSTSADVSAGIRIATFDIADGIGKIKDDIFDTKTGEVVNVPVQFGNDTEIKRYLDIRTDALKGGTPLINGVRYYFAVTSYSYNPANVVPNNLENPLQVFTVVPHSKNPGDVFEAGYADTLEVTRNLTAAEGASDGFVYPIVVDPTKLTGLDYTVIFAKQTIAAVDDTGGVSESVIDVWHLDRSDGKRVLENQTNQSADEESPIIDGLQIRVSGAPLDIKAIDLISNANGPIPNSGLASYEMTPPPTDVGAISADWYRDVALSPNGGALGIDDAMQAAGGFFFIVAGAKSIADHDAAIGRWTRDGSSWPLLIPNNLEMRFTAEGGMAVWPSEFHEGNIVAGTYPVPFELWFLGPNLDNPSDDVRMIPVILDEADTVGTPNPPSWGFTLDHEASGGNNDPASDWIYWYMPGDQTPGDVGYQAAISGNPDTRGEDWTEYFARMMLMNWNLNQGDGGIEEIPEVGSVFRIRMTIPNAAGVDEFYFTSPAPTNSSSLAAEEIEKINVFPNPYYAVNSEEINKYNRFVTFSHLPQNATIRIFNLAGVHVKTIVKENSSQFQRWDLANMDGLPVASGLYIAYIDMDEIGKTKILKLAIIQEQQILDRF
jgi:hypothetical protein